MLTRTTEASRITGEGSAIGWSHPFDCQSALSMPVDRYDPEVWQLRSTPREHDKSPVRASEGNTRPSLIGSSTPDSRVVLVPGSGILLWNYCGYAIVLGTPWILSTGRSKLGQES